MKYEVQITNKRKIEGFCVRMRGWSNYFSVQVSPKVAPVTFHDLHCPPLRGPLKETFKRDCKNEKKTELSGLYPLKQMKYKCKDKLLLRKCQKLILFLNFTFHIQQMSIFGKP